MSFGETRHPVILDRFGGLITDIAEQRLNGESPDLHNVSIILGGTGIKTRGGLEPLLVGLNETDPAQEGVYYRVFRRPNPIGEGWLFIVQEQPTREIVAMWLWKNDYPTSLEEVSMVYFGQIIYSE